jgi:hypothetical protein
VIVFQNRVAPETPLKHVTVTTGVRASAQVRGVTTRYPLQIPGERSVGLGHDHRVKVIRHDGDAIDLDGVAGFSGHHQVQEALVVGIREKQATTIVPAVDDVVRIPHQSASRFSGHWMLQWPGPSKTAAGASLRAS